MPHSHRKASRHDNGLRGKGQSTCQPEWHHHRGQTHQPKVNSLSWYDAYESADTDFVPSQGGWRGSIHVPSAGPHSSGCQVTSFACWVYCTVCLSFCKEVHWLCHIVSLDQGHSITIVGQSLGTGDTKRLSHVWQPGLDRPITACSRGSHGGVERGGFSVWTRERFARERAVDLNHTQDFGRHTVCTLLWMRL